MDWVQAIVLGTVEGLTEYLPVSSTAHLLLTQRLMNISKTDASDAYAICIQSGAIVAVIGIFWNRIREMILGLLGKNPAGLRLAIQIIVAFLPAAVIGIAINKWIKSKLFFLEPICGAWFVGGLAILALASWLKKRGAMSGKDLSGLTIQGAAIIGLIQCLGMIPGTSRSLVTIFGALLVGLNLAAALEFSFLLGLVTLTAATAYDAYKHGQEMLAEYDVATLGVGFLAAAIAAFVAVEWMLRRLKEKGLAMFGIYRIVLAIAVFWAIRSGYITP